MALTQQEEQKLKRIEAHLMAEDAEWTEQFVVGRPIGRFRRATRYCVWLLAEVIRLVTLALTGTKAVTSAAAVSLARSAADTAVLRLRKRRGRRPSRAESRRRQRE